MGFQDLPREIVIEITLQLEGIDLFRLLQVNRVLWSLFEDRLLWQKRLSEPGDNELSVQELRVRYIRRCRAVSALEGQQQPTVVGGGIEVDTELKDKLYTCISRGRSPVLWFRTEKGTGKTMILDLRKNRVSKHNFPFRPFQFFNHGMFCLGYETGRKVVRRVEDWAVVAQLDTDPDDTFFQSGRAQRIWTTGGLDSNVLLHVDRDRRRDSKNNIEVWESTGKIYRGTMSHPDAMRWVHLPSPDQFLTLDRKGEARIWDMRHLTYETVPVDLHGAGPVAEVVCHGHILRFYTDDNAKDIGSGLFSDNTTDARYSETYYHLLHQPLPTILQGTRESGISQGLWVEFSDGTYVLYDGKACRFLIFSSGGVEQGSFENPRTRKMITFMDRYIITISRDTDVKIWNQRGALLYTTRCRYSNPELVESMEGSFTVLEYDSQETISHVTTWDFSGCWEYQVWLDLMKLWGNVFRA